MDKDIKRLFVGMEATAPWPKAMPAGRTIHEAERHATLAFLGSVDWHELKPLMGEFPSPTFPCGVVGIFDKILFLPKHHPHVVSWQVNLLSMSAPMAAYQKTIANWLSYRGFLPSEKDQTWLPHVTLAREPFEFTHWRTSFTPLPVVFKAIHLYESLGHSRYYPLWSLPLIEPWLELEHTADIAFEIHGSCLSDIYTHAHTALAFQYPSFVKFMPQDPTFDNLDDVIITLNESIALCDATLGCPFKAVSWHGELIPQDTYLKWEMIVDV
jgi:2'-5' RNA ligase